MSVAAVAGQTVTPDLTSIYGNATTDDGPDQSLGKDAFLKLLVAQLKYQDPMKPTDSSEFIASTAQFTMVEKLDELTQQGATQNSINQVSTASALVGKEITVTGADGRPQSSVVQRTQLIGGEIMVVTDLGTVSLNQIVGIGTPGSAAADTAETSTEETSTAETGTTGTSSAETSTTETPVVTDSTSRTTTDAASDTAETETTGTDATDTVNPEATTTGE